MENKKQFLADCMILAVTFSWGVSYYMMDLSLNEMGTFTLNAYRFGVAFLVSIILLRKKINNISIDTIKYGALIGIIVTVMYTLATEAVKYTNLTNIGFLIALNVIITPTLEYILTKTKPSKKLFIVLIICFTGIVLMTLKENFSINKETFLGDFLCILCAFACSVQLILVDRAVRKENVKALHLGIFQMGFTGLFFTILAFGFESPALPVAKSVWISVIFLSLVCTGIAFIAQSIAQQYTTASHAGIMFSFEPVFAAIAAFLLAGEVLSTRGYLGGGLMFISILIMETNIEKLFKKAV
ncbi:MAG TPA: DMT family transporter [Anaerovoracaceae bacterium]|nr:DMT family transporter [Anaerovoracaceae bacterium]